MRNQPADAWDRGFYDGADGARPESPSTALYREGYQAGREARERYRELALEGLPLDILDTLDERGESDALSLRRGTGTGHAR